MLVSTSYLFISSISRWKLFLSVNGDACKCLASYERHYPWKIVKVSYVFHWLLLSKNICEPQVYLHEQNLDTFEILWPEETDTVYHYWSKLRHNFLQRNVHPVLCKHSCILMQIFVSRYHLNFFIVLWII